MIQRRCEIMIPSLTKKHCPYREHSGIKSQLSVSQTPRAHDWTRHRVPPSNEPSSPNAMQFVTIHADRLITPYPSSYASLSRLTDPPCSDFNFRFLDEVATSITSSSSAIGVLTP